MQHSLSLHASRKHRSLHKRRFGGGRRRGAVLVEAALCLVFVLLPVTLGGFQFAIVFMTTHAMQQITRESARFAAVHHNDATFDMDENQGNSPGQTPSLRNFVRKQAAANGIAWKEISGQVLANGSKGSVVITPDGAQRTSGKPLTITLTYPMRQRAFLGSLFFKEKNAGGEEKVVPLRLGFLQNDFKASSTILME